MENGAAIFLKSNNTSIINSHFVNNSAHENAGAIFLKSSNGYKIE